MTSTRNGGRPARTWTIAAVAGLFGLLYAFAVWNGVAQVVLGLQAGAELTPMMWAMWVLTIVIPIVVYAAALSAGRRRGAGRLTLLFLAGLAVVGVFWLNVLAYVMYTNLSSLLVG